MRKEFKIKSGKMVLSDPCYDLGAWCQGVIDNVKNGEWVADAQDTIAFGGRIVRLTAYHIDYPTSSDDIQFDGELMDFDGGVDSGQFGYFDFSEYRNDKSIIGVERIAEPSQIIICEDEPFYSICCDRTLSNDMWGVIPFGVISSSGIGDGSYPTYGIKNGDGEYVAFTTIFLDPDEDFDDEEEEYFNNHPEPTDPKEFKNDLPY